MKKKWLDLSRIILIITANFLSGHYLCAQKETSDAFNPKLRYNLPVIDANHWKNAAFTGANFDKPNSDGKPKFRDWAVSMIKNPGMYQATELNLDAVNTLVWGSQILTNKLIKPKTFVRKVGNVITTQLLSVSSIFVLGGFPLGGGWLHEEYHRAMLATNRVASKNPFDDYHLDITDGSVKNIYDNALRNFKKNDPYGFNRMLIAGAEGELLSARRMQENNFFNNANLPAELVSFFYINSAATYFSSNYSNIDSTSIQANRTESNMLIRDFTGHDFSGWIWHLFKPDIPYDSLGIHPSGVGINRYITSDRLTQQEKYYYEKTKSLAVLNFISPMIFGFRKIRLKEGTYGNFAIQYQPTSFGVDLEFRFYLMNKYNKYCFSLHNYRNYNNNFYSAELNWVDFSFKKLEKFSFTSRIMVGTQPKNQEFFTNRSRFFGVLSVSTIYRINNHLGAYWQLQAKSDGWVAGDEYLKSMIRLRAGMSLTL